MFVEKALSQKARVSSLDFSIPTQTVMRVPTEDRTRLPLDLHYLLETVTETIEAEAGSLQPLENHPTKAPLKPRVVTPWLRVNT